MRPVEITARFILERIVLRVEKVGATLTIAGDVQLIRAQRTTHVISHLRESVSSLEVEPAAHAARHRCLERVVVGEADVAGITRTTFARQADDLVSELFVVRRVGRNRVAGAVHIAHRDWVGRTGDARQERIPDADATGVMRSDVANLNGPTVCDLTWQSDVVLLSVGRVCIEWRTGKRCEVDRAVGRSAAVVQTLLTGCVHKDRTSGPEVRSG